MIVIYLTGIHAQDYLDNLLQIKTEGLPPPPQISAALSVLKGREEKNEEKNEVKKYVLTAVVTYITCRGNYNCGDNIKSTVNHSDTCV